MMPACTSRRIVFVAFPEFQALDVFGPSRGVLRGQALPARAPTRSSSWPRGPGGGHLERRAGADRTPRWPTAAARSTRSSSPAATACVARRDGRAPDRAGCARAARALAAGGLRVHRRVPARRAPGCSTAAAPPRTGAACDAAGAALPASRRSSPTRSSCATATSHLGGRHRRDGPGAGAGRGGPRPPRWRSKVAQLAGAVPAAPRRAVAVQRRSSPRRPPSASRCASCRRGSPTTSTRTCRCPRSPSAPA